MKIGTGEFTKNNKTELRNYYFKVIEELAPHVVESMELELYPLYVNAFPKHDAKKYLHIRNKNNIESNKFHDRLLTWCEKNKLKNQWAMDRLVFILSTWKKEYIEDSNGQKIKRRGRIHTLPGNENIYNIPETKPSITDLGPWDAWFETEEEFRARIEGYILEVRKAYLEAGWEERLTKRDRGAGPLIHLKWLVQQLFCNKSIEDMAQDYIDTDTSGNLGIGDDTVRKAINTVTHELNS